MQNQTSSAPKLLVIVNTVVCTLAFLPSIFLLFGIVMGIAVFEGREQLGLTILILSALSPITMLVSVAGSWLMMERRTWAITFVALPWATVAAQLIAIAVLFKDS